MRNKQKQKTKLALFDVDGTILKINSMLSFVDYFFNEYYGEDLGSEKSKEYALKRANDWKSYPREALNRLYYSHYSGINELELFAIGEKWYQQTIEGASSDIFNESVLKKLEDHKNDGFRVVFISGGFRVILNPLAQTLGVNDILCVTPSIVQGFFTGEIEGIQTIGEGKATAISSGFDHSQIDWANSYAYGDHSSDLQMLELVGKPVVVGSNEELIKIAVTKGWETISI